MEREEVARLFRQYGDDVFHLAYSYLANRPDAEDICQTVFLKLAEGRTELTPGREKAWLPNRSDGLLLQRYGGRPSVCGRYLSRESRRVLFSR